MMLVMVLVMIKKKAITWARVRSNQMLQLSVIFRFRGYSLIAIHIFLLNFLQEKNP